MFTNAPARLLTENEVILPSFTYVPTANALEMRGAVPVFVDIVSDTLELDEKKVTSTLTEKPKPLLLCSKLVWGVR